MRKMILFVLLAVTMFLSSCNNEETESSVELKVFELSTLITTAGYNMEAQTYGNIFDYHRQEIYNKYDLDPDLYAVYRGLDDNEEDIFLVAFTTIKDADDYVSALQNDPDEDRLIYLEDYVVVLTYSEDILELFD